MQLVNIAIGRLTPDPTQPRGPGHDEDLGHLTESIRTRGLLQPIRVRPADASGNHAIVLGHRRLSTLTRT